MTSTIRNVRLREERIVMAPELFALQERYPFHEQRADIVVDGEEKVENVFEYFVRTCRAS